MSCESSKSPNGMHKFANDICEWCGAPSGSEQRQPTGEDLIRAAANLLMEPILRVLQADPHQWSERPCQTCRAITSLVGKPFGCYLWAIERSKRNA